jgi:hypothetical protein
MIKGSERRGGEGKEARKGGEGRKGRGAKGGMGWVNPENKSWLRGPVRNLQCSFSFA